MKSTSQNLNRAEPKISESPCGESAYGESACGEAAGGEFAPHWFAAYTQPNHEKSVARQMNERSIPHYLPLYESVRQWKDRKMRLDLPLFPGYVFVRMPLQNRLKVIQVPSVIRLVVLEASRQRFPKPSSPRSERASIMTASSSRTRCCRQASACGSRAAHSRE